MRSGTRIRSRLIFNSILGLSTGWMMTPAARGNTDSWIGSGTSANWSEDANWLYNRTGADPVLGNGAPITNDNLFFTSPTTNGFTTLNNDLSVSTLPSISFDVSANAYTLNGN